MNNEYRFKKLSTKYRDYLDLDLKLRYNYIIIDYVKKLTCVKAVLLIRIPFILASRGSPLYSTCKDKRDDNTNRLGFD